MSSEVPTALPSGLRRWVSEATVVPSDGPDARRPPPLVHLPDVATSLIFRTATATAPYGDLLVAGPRTRASYYAGKDLPPCLRIRLRPGVARALLGVSVSELVDRVVPFGERVSADPQRVLSDLEATLSARFAAQTNADQSRADLVRAAAEALAPPDRPALPDLARRLAISERHLRALFADAVGLPPKRFERIARVRRVLAHGGARTPRWAQFAAATGYYDQSHMTAEFHTMMGVPPAAFFAGRLPPLLPCHVTSPASGASERT